MYNGYTYSDEQAKQIHEARYQRHLAIMAAKAAAIEAPAEMPALLSIKPAKHFCAECGRQITEEQAARADGYCEDCATLPEAPEFPYGEFPNYYELRHDMTAETVKNWRRDASA